MPEEDLVDIKFRLYDGSDMGPFRYSSASTVEVLKERIVSEWPRGKTIVPKVGNEIKLISFGKILENNKTVGQCRAPFGELSGGVMVMHVVVQPSLAKAKTGFMINCSADGSYVLDSRVYLLLHFPDWMTVGMEGSTLPPTSSRLKG